MIRDYYAKIISEGLKRAFPQLDIKNLRIDILKPRRPEWGDISSNIPVVLSKNLKRAPDEIADILVKKLKDMNQSQDIGRFAEKIEFADPGFINIFISRDFAFEIIKTVFKRRDRFGSSDQPKGESYLVEYVSANPTGPLHIGHGRGAVLGDVICRVLKSQGYNVLREFYVNDSGAQVENLVVSVIERIKEIEGRGEAEIPPDGYKGEYVKDIAKRLLEEKNITYEDAMNKRDVIREFAVGFMKSRIADTLRDLGVEFDNFFSERWLYENNLVQDCIGQFRAKGLVYEKDGALFLKMEESEDDKDRVLRKSNGYYTYFASDIAYHRHKYEREEKRYNRIIDIWGADHHGYIQRMRGAIELMEFDPSSFIVLLVQMVRVIRDGKPLKMSKREGDFITLDEIIRDVGRDATRYTFLMRKGDAQLDFDIDILKSQSLNNPVYYAQYGYARICSILRKAEGMNIPLPSDISRDDFNALVLKEEIDIIKKIGEFPDLLSTVAKSLEPHLLVYYIQELEAMFHQYYTQYKKSERVLSDDPKKLRGRLVMIMALKIVLKNAFDVMGVFAPERMSLKGDMDEE